jgi:hypothetical protein
VKVIEKLSHTAKLKCVCGKVHNVKYKNIHKKKCNCGYDVDSEFRPLLHRYIRQAEKRGYQFKIKFEHFKHMVQSKCYYCGQEPKQKMGDVLYNGVDRIDNTVGYELGNVVACCGTCNKAKGTMGAYEFEDWLERINTRSPIRNKQSSESLDEFLTLNKDGFLHGTILQKSLVKYLIYKGYLKDSDIKYNIDSSEEFPHQDEFSKAFNTIYEKGSLEQLDFALQTLVFNLKGYK